jgi:hypothetical protein
MTAPTSFKESDLLRAIKTAVKAGLHVAGFEINPRTGNIRVHTGGAEDAAPAPDDWDKVLGHEDQ